MSKNKSMKVKDLDESVNLQKVKVKLSSDVLKVFKDYCGGEEIMFIAGPMMGEFFMKSTKKGKDGNYQLFPLPGQYEPENILEWEVVEEKPKTKKK
jgi:hypothetical protein